MNPILNVTNELGHDLFGYAVFTYIFHLWDKDKAKNEEKIDRK